MPTIPLPENASLEHLKKQAKLVQELVASSDSGGLDLIREFHPRFAATASEAVAVGFKRSDAQLVVARLYGFASWTKLRDHVGLVNDFTRSDPADVVPNEDADRFVALACVSYNGDHDPHARTVSARTMLDSNPELASASTAAIAVSGHHEAMTELIAQDPKVVNEPCGPNGWPPLLYCSYSRLDSSDAVRSTLATAQVLLDAGADPNAGFLWHALVPPFTALTGAFGRGEADQAPHYNAIELARLLLEAGADPNDGQALYNNGLAGTAHDDASHLLLLVEFGLGTPTDGPWYERFGTRLTAPDQLLDDELEVAAHRGLATRMQFLAELGLDLDRPVGRSRRTPWQLANAGGHTAVIDVLTQAGVQELFAVYNAGPQPVMLTRGDPTFLLWITPLDQPTDKPYANSKNGRTEITAAEIMKIQGEVATPQALARRVNDLEDRLDRHTGLVKTIVRIVAGTLITLAVGGIAVYAWQQVIEAFTDDGTEQEEPPPAATVGESTDG